jgi:ribosome-associated heat shock protein Hsp15
LLQDDRQRVDRWLWHARIVRTRVLAAALASSGHVRLNGRRVTAAGRAVRIGDVLTIALPTAIRVLRILGFAHRRGGAGQAKGLYDDLSPLPERATLATASPQRDPGTGRPTKRDRRALERLRQRSVGQDR